MAFTVSASPAVLVNEIDLTNVIPAVSTTEGAFAGVFRWGPVDQNILIDSETNLVKRFGQPTNFNPETFFTAANFLAYGNRLYISRAADVTGNNFTKTYSGNSTDLAIASSNNILQLSNTDNITVGMKLFYSNNSALPLDANVTSVNSTAVVLSSSATANVESVEVVFRENITYTAVGQQSDIDYNASDITDWDEQIIKNEEHYEAREANGDSFDVSVLYVARYPGEMGNSLRVSVCDSNSQFISNTSLSPNASFDANNCLISGNVGSNSLSFTVTPEDTANATIVGVVNTHVYTLYNSISVGDLIEVGNTRLGIQYLQVTSKGDIVNTDNVFTWSVSTDDEVKVAGNTVNHNLVRFWEFYNAVDVSPGQSDYVAEFGNTSANDELHIVVVDDGGKFTGSPGTILEVHRNLSRATDAKNSDGSTNYYKTVINQRSQYIWWANDRTTAKSNTASNITSSSGLVPLSMTFIGGSDGPNEADVPFATLAHAYDKFSDAEEIDISLVLQGKARGQGVSNFSQLGNYLIDNIAEKRKDCVAFISPDYADVVDNKYEEVNDITEFRSTLRASSYGFCDSGYKQMYDKYNDVYRWVPLNGDIAGLCVRTDDTNDPWWSFAGLNRGQIKNVVRLAYNPKKAERDSLYKADVNPVISTSGQGTYLFGDKTLLGKPSAFSRINVRRLFIVLEKAIATSAKYILFEFNDDFTRAMFRNMVNPYLRTVKGRRGVYDYLVVCDATNNTPEIIDNNQFVGSIFIKPARSINTIQLNFIATRTGVSFSEVTGVV